MTVSTTQIKDLTNKTPESTDSFPVDSAAGITRRVTLENLQVYGSMYQAAEQGISLGATGTAAWLTATAGPSQGMTVNVAHATSDRITALVSGDYDISWSATIRANSSPDAGIYTAELFINGVAAKQSLSDSRYLSGVNDIGSTAFGDFQHLDAGDYIAIQFTTAVVNGDIYLSRAALRAELVGHD